MDEGGVRVHHLEVEERTAVSERRRHMGDQFEVMAPCTWA
jgi:hypothetical protein